MGFFLSAYLRDEGSERPTGGLADYRQVKPWKKRDISGKLYSVKRGMAKALS
jgi:hypothetical protein